MYRKHFSITAIFVSLLFIAIWALAEETQAVISFKEPVHDFGDVIQEEVVSHEFEFENTGQTSLILRNVLTTCGCTVTSWPKEPIPPGGKRNLKVYFNTRWRLGAQTKTILVISNATNTREKLTITANVLPKR